MSTSSNEFAALINQLHRSPNDPVLKRAIVAYLPKITALAQENPMALYHFAHIYAPNSPQYKQTMRQSANLGCTNAMLVMCQILGKSNDPGDLKKAAHYLEMIHQSSDSYIKEQSKLLLEEYPQLARTIQDQSQPDRNSGHYAHRFFMPQLKEKDVKTAPEESLTLSS